MTHGGRRPGAGRPSSDPKRSHLHIRVSTAKLEAWREAAAFAGVDLTTWVEKALDRAADFSSDEAGL